eukprot:scaffold139646_cov20-Prasinocladus_malaysianus.AAC.1
MLDNHLLVACLQFIHYPSKVNRNVTSSSAGVHIYVSYAPRQMSQRSCTLRLADYGYNVTAYEYEHTAEGQSVHQTCTYPYRSYQH